MNINEDNALKFARNKAIREQRDVLVFKRSSGYFKLQPAELHEGGEEPFERVRVEDISSEKAKQILDEIDDHSDLDRGDQVIVDDSVEKIVRVTEILFETESGARFLRSDGTGYGSEDREINHKVKQTWT